MNQLGLLHWLACLTATAILFGCGGGNKAITIGAATTVTLTPTSLSLDFGQVSGVAAQVTDANKNVINTGTVTFQSSDSTGSTGSLVSVANSGLVCAGKWDSLTTPVVCTPATISGTANITATSSGITSSPTVVTVHPRIASLTISAPAAACISDTKTLQFSAVARDSNGAVILNIGTPSWVTTNVNVATIDVNGLATAKQPGVMSLFASVNGVSSLPATFITCPPASISIITSDTNAPTSLTLAAAATSQLTATAIDTLGNPMPDVVGVLTYSTSQPAVVTVGATGLVTAVAAGNSGIVASCTPPGCNPGGTPVYSNRVSASVSGTSASTVYVTGSNATTIIPIDTTANMAGTAITIPQIGGAQPVVNSFVFNKAGTKAFIGTNLGFLVLDPTANTIATPVILPGRILAVSPNSIKVVIAAQNGTQVYVFDTSTGGFDTLAIAASTAADYSTDNFKAFIVSGTNLYAYPPATPLTTITLAAAATDVTFLSEGSAAYLAGGSTAGVNVRATCDNSSRADIAASPAPRFIASSFDSTRAIGVNTSNVYDVPISLTSAACPPTPAGTTVASVPLGAAPVTISQLVLSPDGSRAFVLSDLTNILQYNTGSGAKPVPIALTGGSATTGGMTLDSKNLYVGISGTNTVQRIDTSSSAAVATAPISVPLGAGVSPDFVAVRPK